MMRRFYDSGVTELNGHLLYALPDGEYAAADAWLERQGIPTPIAERPHAWQDGGERFGRRPLRQGRVAVRRRLAGRRRAGDLRRGGGRTARIPRARGRAAPTMSAADWRAFAERASLYAAREKAKELGADVAWDCERAKTPEGYYQIRGGIPYAIAKSLAAAPFADILWMETKTADLADAREFAEAIHAVYPGQDAGLQPLPLVQLGHHRHDRRRDARLPRGDSARWASSSTSSPTADTRSTASPPRSSPPRCEQDGMLALARLQRKMRLVESPYRTPQTLVGGPRSDAALAASSGRTATTKSMGKGSTQHQHLVQTEVPKKLLEEWLALWSDHYQLGEKLRVQLRPRRAGGDVLDLGIYGDGDGEQKLANVLVDPDQGPARPQHPHGARPEHVRREAAPEAADDVDPPLADPSLQGRRGVLRHAHRGQHLSDREDEVPRHLPRRATRTSARSSSPT